MITMQFITGVCDSHFGGWVGSTFKAATGCDCAPVLFTIGEDVEASITRLKPQKGQNFWAMGRRFPQSGQNRKTVSEGAPALGSTVVFGISTGCSSLNGGETDGNEGALVIMLFIILQNEQVAFSEFRSRNMK